MSYKPVHIPLVKGHAEKIDERVAPEGTLAAAKNVVHDKRGTFSKRRGFFLIDASDEVFGGVFAESNHHALGSLDGTLFVFGYDNVFAVGSRGKALNNGQDSVVIRSYVPRGMLWQQPVIGSGGGATSGAPS